jgi:hypothetical protein
MITTIGRGLPSPTDVDPWFEDTDEQTFRPWLGDMPVAG